MNESEALFFRVLFSQEVNGESGHKADQHSIHYVYYTYIHALRRTTDRNIHNNNHITIRQDIRREENRGEARERAKMDDTCM